MFGTHKVIRKENKEKKMKGKKNWRKIKNRFKLKKLVLYVYSNSFYLFISIT